MYHMPGLHFLLNLGSPDPLRQNLIEKNYLGEHQST